MSEMIEIWAASVVSRGEDDQLRMTLALGETKEEAIGKAMDQHPDGVTIIGRLFSYATRALETKTHDQGEG